MILTSFEQLKEMVNAGYLYVPIAIKEKKERFNPIALYQKIREQGEYHFIFESGKIGRYTYIGGNPIFILRGKNNETEKINRDQSIEKFEGDPLDILKTSMKLFQTPKLKDFPKFYGGTVGYLSYDMSQYFERLPNMAEDDLFVPDLYFMVMDQIFVYDHQEKMLYYLEWLQINHYGDLKEIYDTKLKQMEKLWLDWVIITDDERSEIEPVISEADRSMIETSFTKENFIKAVEKVKQYIAQGDVFQVNLSVRQSRSIATEDIEIYQHLRQINPSPYMGLIHFPDLQLVSGSPELLIEVKEGMIQTRPIAGTRPRGKNESEDEQMVQELLNNEKERAEHIMLVDLERNDLGRVCQYGTVDVEELMVVEKYSHVMHIVSNVKGRIDNKFDHFDCIKATFPGGTITGAPKIRTMEIIEELEPVKRGPYTGSMGWIGFQEDLELNILIRTLLIKEGKGYIQAGAGIVIDSIPENEYIESLNKAEALWRAVESSERNRKKENSKWS